MIRKNEMRIASLQPSITITLAALNRLDHLSACTRYCLEALPELAERNPYILHDSWTANTDEILATKPDLVIASVPYRMESLAAILKSGLPVLTLAPHTLADVHKDIRLIAAVVDAQSEAEALITQMQSALEATRLRSARALPYANRLLRRVGKAPHPLSTLGRRTGRSRRRHLPRHTRRPYHP